MRKISTPYEYIDTLYLAWRFDIDKTKILEAEFYSKFKGRFEIVGTSQGYHWFLLPNFGRIGVIADYENIYRANAYSFIIQYDNEYLLKESINNLDIFPKKIDTLIFPRLETKIKRIDFSIITNDTRILSDSVDSLSRYRSQTVIKKGDRVETVYLGKRANGKVFRYYRKDIELMQDKNILKADYFRFYFPDIDFNKPVMVAELELHRKHLMPKYGINGFADWNKILTLFRQNFMDIKFYVKNDENIRLIEQRHHDKVETICFDFVVKKKLEQNRDQYKPSLSFLFSRVDKIIQKFLDRTGKSITKTELLLNATKGYLPLVALKELDYFEIRELLDEQDLYLLDLDGKISAKIELKPTKPIEEFTLEELNVGGRAGIVQNPRDLF